MSAADQRRFFAISAFIQQPKTRNLLRLSAAVIALHILQEMFLGTSPLGSFLSNALQISCAVVASVACFAAIRRSVGYTRFFWLLIGLSFAVWIFADAGWLYYESYLRKPPDRESIFHFFVDCRALFLAMALLLDPEEEDRPYYWNVPSVLDAVQLFIIFALIYLGWYQATSRDTSRVISLIRSDEIELGGNIAVLGVAAFQAIRARTSPMRKLYLGLLIWSAPLITGIVFTDFHELSGSEIPTGTWIDLWWSIPFLMAAFWALSWKQTADFYPRVVRNKGIVGTLLEKTLYAAGPLIVLLQVTNLGPEWRKLSFGLLGISIVCFGARLAFSEFQQAEATARVREANRSLRQSEARLREFERVVEGLDEMIVVVDQEYRYLLANQSFLDYRGMKKEEVIGRELRSVLNPAVFDSIIKPKLNECFEGKLVRYEMKYVHAQKGERHLAISYFPISGPLGVDRVACILEDITDWKKSEQALRESEDRYRDLVEHSEDLVCTHDLQGSLLSVNPAPARILGYEVSELLKTPMRDLIVPEFRENFDAYLETIKTRGTARGLLCVATRNGERRVWEYSNTLRTEGVSSPVVRGLAHDVTDREKAERALRESEARMRLFIEHAPAAAALFDTQMRYIQASRRWRDDYGLGDRELCGLSHYEIFPEIPERWKQAHRRGLAGEVLREEKDRFIRADGRVQWLRWEIQPWYEQGHIGGIAIFAEDITQAELQTEALRQSENRYRTLFEKSVAGVACVALNGTILDCNDAWARILGHSSASECRGAKINDYYRDHAQRELMVSELKKTGYFLNREWEHRHKDGSPIWVLLNTVLLNDESGELVIQGTMIDITERKRAEQVLIENEKLERERARELQTILDTLPIPLLISKDPECEQLSMNRAAAMNFGLSAEKVAVSSFMEGPTRVRFMRGDEELPKEKLPMQMAAATGSPVRNVAYKVVFPDGSEKYELGHAAPLIDGNGKLVGAVGAALDITDRMRAEEALRRSEERFRVALKDSPITVFNQDRDLRYTWIYNPQFYQDHEIIGKTDEDIFSSKSARLLAELKRQVIQTGMPVREEVALPKNGSTYVFDLRVEPVFGADGQVIGITGSAVDIARLREMADRLQESTDRLSREKSYLQSEIRTELGFEEIIGQSPSLREVLAKARVVAPTDSTVLLLGETGTGKELVARSVHDLSTRREHTFVKLNCAAVPSGLMESELFGHEKGAFTGAISQKVGRIELAHKGTLFLDEIGELPLELQPKLLRVLQDREFERLGGVKTLSVDVRIIAATNRDLRQDVADKKFREDLFYRLNVFPIQLPSLRERREDIPSLVYHFVQKHCLKMSKEIDHVPDAVMKMLRQWSWPGNVRELENMVERMVILTKGRALVAPPAEIQAQKGVADDDLTDMEREHIIRVLRETHGVLSGTDGAANRLGVKRTTLQSMMKRLGIDVHDYRTWGSGNGRS
ncbi:MAG TPA: PAS domain S-box protein [Candidatus Sulfotelmatobacter sp.]|nr:PAS domain S-box protein [Candidatus Sulfotelmatobacter sp.]